MIKVRLEQPKKGPFKGLTKNDMNMTPDKSDEAAIEIRSDIGFDKPANKWVTFKFPNRKMRMWERLCVEAYCCGFLEYYDSITRYRFSNHHIYFDWKQNAKLEYSVAVYIDPPPLKNYPPSATDTTFVSDPVPPTKPPPPPMS